MVGICWVTPPILDPRLRNRCTTPSEEVSKYLELHFDLCSQLSQSPSYFASGQRHSGEVSKYLELHFDLRSPLSQGPGS